MVTLIEHDETGNNLFVFFSDMDISSCVDHLLTGNPFGLHRLVERWHSQLANESQLHIFTYIYIYTYIFIYIYIYIPTR